MRGRGFIMIDCRTLYRIVVCSPNFSPRKAYSPQSGSTFSSPSSRPITILERAITASHLLQRKHFRSEEKVTVIVSRRRRLMGILPLLHFGKSLWGADPFLRQHIRGFLRCTVAEHSVSFLRRFSHVSFLERDHRGDREQIADKSKNE